jgi:GTP:adenosylcobinamide-phosphate guanylyltransferase
MDVILAAGGTPQPGQPLYEYTQGAPKALLEIAGKAMIQWVLDALSATDEIGQVVIVGLETDNGLRCDKPLSYVPNQGGMVANVRAATQRLLELDPQAEYALAVSSDIPAITPEMVDWIAGLASDRSRQLYYTVISQEVMEKRFPGSNRSFYKLKDVAICGSDMHVVSTALVMRQDGIFDQLAGSRKNAFNQARMIGLDTLFYMVFRRLTLTEMARQVSKRLKIDGTAVLSPYAEIGMDVDKPHQLELLRADLAARYSQ